MVLLKSCEILDELRQLGISNASDLIYYFGDYAVYCRIHHMDTLTD